MLPNVEATVQSGDPGGFGESFIELTILFKMKILEKEQK